MEKNKACGHSFPGAYSLLKVNINQITIIHTNLQTREGCPVDVFPVDLKDAWKFIRNGELRWRPGWAAFHEERTAPTEAVGGRSMARSTTQRGNEREHSEGCGYRAGGAR